MSLSIRSFAKVVVNKTGAGKSVLEARAAARVAVTKPLPVEAPVNVAHTVADMALNIIHNGKKIMSDLMKERDFRKGSQTYTDNILDKLLEIPQMSNEPLATVVESFGVGPSKFFQMIADDESIMSQLPEQLRKSIRNIKTDNTPTRSLKEAQGVLNTSFGDSYKIKKRAGVGVVGEAYFVSSKTGQNLVAKMIKKGIDKDYLEAEQKVLSKVVEHLSEDGEEGKRKAEMLSALYEEWKKEIDFTNEVANNKALAKGAQRYKVADVVALSDDAKCVIYEEASGVQASKFVKMVQEFRENPSQYSYTYADEITHNPWLGNPESVLGEFCKSYIKSFSEMMLFLKKDGKSVMHGDPHAGNVFVSATKEGKVMPTYIDTGCCITRSSKDVANDLKFFTNYFVGNSQEIASYFMEKAHSLPANSQASEIKSALAKKFDERIFKSGGNITDFVQSHKIISSVLQEEKIYLSPKDAAVLKAQMQFISTGLHLHKLSGASSTDVFVDILPDVAKGVGYMAMKENPIPVVLPATKHLYNNSKDALVSFFQFLS